MRLIEPEDASEPERGALQSLAQELERVLGAHAYPAAKACVSMPAGEIEALKQAGRRSVWRTGLWKISSGRAMLSWAG